jgi:hypothetical protein
MSTTNWAFETPALPQPFQVAIDTAAIWLRNVRKACRNILGLRMNIDYMDEEDSWTCGRVPKTVPSVRSCIASNDVGIDTALRQQSV